MSNRERLELVVKNNDLIRKTRYSLSEQQQKIIIYLISKIKQDDKEFNKVEISIKDYCRICNINYDGKSSAGVKKSIKTLSDKSWWILVDDTEILFRWIEGVKINKGIITLKLSDFLKPYLLELRENFTKYELINVLVLRGKFSIRLYEIFKSYLWKEVFSIDLEELKSVLQCENYTAYKDFRVRVLDSSITEINDYTDIEVKYSPIKEGKKVVALRFNIKEKRGVQMTFDALIRQNERLNNGK